MSEQSTEVGAIAGAAAATAGVAREEAKVADEKAEQASEQADMAQRSASSAAETAWDAQTAVAGLRSDMEAGFASIAELFSRQPEPDGEKDDGKPHAPESRAKEQPESAEGGAQPAEEKAPKGGRRRMKWGGHW